MVGYYCKKCNTDNPAPQCASCGARLAAKTARVLFHETRLPALDAFAWRGAVTVLIVSALLLMLALLALEFAIAGAQGVARLAQGALLPGLLLVLFLGTALIAAVLLAQGREENFYTLDDQGAHLQTWVRDSRVKCFFRMQTYARCKETLAQSEAGQSMLLVENRVIPWQDITRVEYKRMRVLLYASSAMPAFSPKPPAEDMEGLARFLEIKLKQSRQSAAKKK